MTFKTRTIEIKHKIDVDICLADEIEKLNNVHGIVTLACCCGHGFDEDALIVVVDNAYKDIDNFHDVSINRMRKLGYEIKDFYTYDAYTLNKNNKLKPTKKKYISFKPKSKCKCTIGKDAVDHHKLVN